MAWQAGGKALRHEFRQNAWGILDWGRGVWPSPTSGTGQTGGPEMGIPSASTWAAASATPPALPRTCCSTAGQSTSWARCSLCWTNPITWPLAPAGRRGPPGPDPHPWYDRTTRTKLLWVDNEVPPDVSAVSPAPQCWTTAPRSPSPTSSASPSTPAITGERSRARPVADAARRSS